MTQVGILNALQNTFVKHAPETNQFTLSVDRKQYVSLHASGQMIQVTAGNAWITHNDEDILLTSGEQTTLPNNGKQVIISAIGTESATFEIAAKGVQ